ncbi:Dihydroorotase [Prochlorococcus sp. MIT 0602]|nr:Dihydroorotase [Prochlorococcus sp. MIT 0602]KGG17082.1 Dihydroorotase [Prochlorococcus sp. MIT 0603]
MDPVKILHGPETKLVTSAVLIKAKHIQAFGEDARALANQLNIKPINSENLIFAPCLVDPHSTLENHLNGEVETLLSLRHKAADAGYGQIALLPKSDTWRDKPQNIQVISNEKKDVLIHLWGSFTYGGEGEVLTSHKDLIQYGAIGLADHDSIIPINLLRKGLLLDESNGKPYLLAPRDKSIQGDGIAREGVAALRSGWHQDPIESETIPLGILLELQKQHTKASIRLMNLSTAEGVSMLENSNPKPLASVSWWHVVSDQSTVNSIDIGIRVTPSLGNRNDRLKIKEGLLNGTITAISVNGISLDDMESKKPAAERIPGLSGYHLVLPALWQELIKKSNWSVEQLWESISFGPSKILNLPPEKLSLNSNRWLLFDPNEKWVQRKRQSDQMLKAIANEPWEGLEITGKVIDCGLKG